MNKAIENYRKVREQEKFTNRHEFVCINKIYPEDDFYFASIILRYKQKDLSHEDLNEERLKDWIKKYLKKELCIIGKNIEIGCIFFYDNGKFTDAEVEFAFDRG